MLTVLLGFLDLLLWRGCRFKIVSRYNYKTILNTALKPEFYVFASRHRLDMHLMIVWTKTFIATCPLKLSPLSMLRQHLEQDIIFEPESCLLDFFRISQEIGGWSENLAHPNQNWNNATKSDVVDVPTLCLGTAGSWWSRHRIYNIYGLNAHTKMVETKTVDGEHSEFRFTKSVAACNLDGWWSSLTFAHYFDGSIYIQLCWNTIWVR